MFHLFFSDSLSWKQGSCVTAKINKMWVNVKSYNRIFHLLDLKILKHTFFPLKVSRGRVQGSLDVSLAVMSINKKSNRIDLDAGDILYHMKVNVVIRCCCSYSNKYVVCPQIKKTCLSKAKSHELFYIWVTKLQAHRLYKKNEAAHIQSGFLQTLSHGTAAGQAQRNGDLVTIKKAIKLK